VIAPACDPRRATPAPVVTIHGDRLPLSPQAISAAARLLAGVVRERRAKKQARQQAGDGTEARP
jgi:hypothetical protein